MKLFFRLFAQPLLVVLGFVLVYALVYVVLGMSVEKGHEVKGHSNKSVKEERSKKAEVKTQEETQEETKESIKESETPSEKEVKEKKNNPLQENKQEVRFEQETKELQPPLAQPDIQSKKESMHAVVKKASLEVLGDYRVMASGVNVRAFPSTKGKIIGSLLRDQVVKVLEIQKDWAKIQLSASVQGYVFLKFLKKSH
ncbi:SH3 domain-containing protein [Helicobacter cetorum]|uniref:SH3b domain-containing protein n=1 Tax=Helicobacter cetorum (strain ATCC BAA-540 / CCUG 52418 / MIT 99-5656) TaxID=1163745 RepID=I0EQ85_HELCM|nr:SH3 domain-containing protein [Helicobacter cetorum]AFI05104.1 hypothetical protein HCD_00360 [Helicobacter cetorum MIT 99-5656]